MSDDKHQNHQPDAHEPVKRPAQPSPHKSRVVDDEEPQRGPSFDASCKAQERRGRTGPKGGSYGAIT